MDVKFLDTSALSIVVSALIGASRPPTGSPMGLPTFFFFFVFLLALRISRAYAGVELWVSGVRVGCGRR